MDDLAALWLDILQEAPCRIRDDAIMILLSKTICRIFFEARYSMPANSLEVVKRRGTHTIMTDTVVPPERFAEFLEFAHGLIRSEGLDYLVFGHLGDCHLHQHLPEKISSQGHCMYARIIEASATLGGVYSGEHGTGKGTGRLPEMLRKGGCRTGRSPRSRELTPTSSSTGETWWNARGRTGGVEGTAVFLPGEQPGTMPPENGKGSWKTGIRSRKKAGRSLRKRMPGNRKRETAEQKLRRRVKDETIRSLKPHVSTSKST